MDVGLGPGDIVLDEDPAPTHGKKTSGPHFLGLRTQESLRPYKPLPMSIVNKRLDGSGCHLVLRYAWAQATLC